ncbi:MAG: hydrogenase maturation protease [Candidatus Bipolaricaulia bacterium]
MGRKTIVLGLGNLLMGDEGVGVHVIRRLQELELPPGVEPVDGGTAGIDLLPVFKEAARVIVVDAVRAGGEAGSIYRFGPKELEEASQEALSLHQLSLGEVLQAASLLGIEPEVTIIGVEPKQIAPGMEISPELTEALPRVIEVILEELSK